MPHVTFIYPAVGRFENTRYVRSWQMQPLVIAALSAMTPSSWQRSFFDDRLEEIDFDQPTDLVAISIETYTARRGYQIAAEYRRRGVAVVMGGYHATSCPNEVLAHADAVCVGQAEGIWQRILEDAEGDCLRGRYESSEAGVFANYDRGIFKDKKYFKIALIETARGCCFNCRFCSIAAFNKGRYHKRPISEIIDEIRSLNEKFIFIIDDNIIGDLQRAKELFTALCELNIKWIGQASINVADDDSLIELMAKSGCVGLLIGFESLNKDNLNCVDKQVNQRADYSEALAKLRKHGIVIYGTFMMGLPADSSSTVEEVVTFAKAEKLFLAAFNHVVPFPGTPLYVELENANRLKYSKWWLSEEFRFGDAPFEPEPTTSNELKQWCHVARCNFYALPSILKRAMDFSANCGTLRKAAMFFGINLLLRKEISQKRGLPLGVRTGRDEC